MRFLSHLAALHIPIGRYEHLMSLLQRGKSMADFNSPSFCPVLQAAAVFVLVKSACSDPCLWPEAVQEWTGVTLADIAPVVFNVHQRVFELEPVKDSRFDSRLSIESSTEASNAETSWRMRWKRVSLSCMVRRSPIGRTSPTYTRSSTYVASAFAPEMGSCHSALSGRDAARVSCSQAGSTLAVTPHIGASQDVRRQTKACMPVTQSISARC
jgi:hypothetical protein